MNRQLIRIYVVVAIAVATCLSACRSGKPQTVDYPRGGEAVQPGALAPQQRFDSLVATYADWQDVQMPVRLQLTSPKSFGVTARCNMRHDRWIQFSVRMLGFEVARVWIDNDSIHAVDRYHKRYLSEGLRRFLGNADVSLANLQDMMLGRAFIAGKGGGTLTGASMSQVRVEPSEQGVMILPKSVPSGFNYGFILSNSGNCLEAASVMAGESSAVTVNYSGFLSTAAGSVCSVASMQTVKGKPIDLSLKWNLESARWNRGEELRWETPRGYTRVQADRLLKMLSEF